MASRLALGWPRPGRQTARGGLFRLVGVRERRLDRFRGDTPTVIDNGERRKRNKAVDDCADLGGAPRRGAMTDNF